MHRFTLPQVFQIPNYRKFWVARQLIAGARQMVTIVVGWQVYDVARRSLAEGGFGWDEPQSAFLVGLVGAAQFVPIFLLSLFGGQAADRMDRKQILQMCQSVRVIAILLLCLTPFLGGEAAMGLLFGCSIVMGAVNAFVPAASNSFYPTLVPRSLLPSAVVWNSIGAQSARIAGPVGGGLLLIPGEQYAYGTSAIMITLALIAVAGIDAPHQAKNKGARGIEMIMEGLRYIRSNRLVLGAITLDFVVVFFAGSVALLPVFARDILHVGEEGYGLLRAAPAAGATLVSVMLAIWPIRRRIGLWMFASVFVFGFSVLAFGLSASFWFSMAMLVIYGGSDMISMYIRQSLIQLSTPDDMKGRVSAVSSVFVSGTNELGEFQSGIAARLLGPVTAVVVGGAIAVGASGLWLKLFPSLRNAERFRDIHEQQSGRE
jgi:MFS family permease